MVFGIAYNDLFLAGLENIFGTWLDFCVGETFGSQAVPPFTTALSAVDAKLLQDTISTLLSHPGKTNQMFS